MSIFRQARISLLASLLLTASAAIAHAQHTDWPLQSGPNGILAIDLVTVANPTVRHKCRVHSITANAITCGVGPLRKPIVYPRENVAALILPPTHAGAITGGFVLAAGIASIALSFSVPVTAVAVIMQIAGGISPFITLSDIVAGNDHSNDVLLYQRPKPTSPSTSASAAHRNNLAIPAFNSTRAVLIPRRNLGQRSAV